MLLRAWELPDRTAVFNSNSSPPSSSRDATYSYVPSVGLRISLPVHHPGVWEQACPTHCHYQPMPLRAWGHSWPAYNHHSWCLSSLSGGPEIDMLHPQLVVPIVQGPEEIPSLTATARALAHFLTACSWARSACHCCQCTLFRSMGTNPPCLPSAVHAHTIQGHSDKPTLPTAGAYMCFPAAQRLACPRLPPLCWCPPLHTTREPGEQPAITTAGVCICYSRVWGFSCHHYCHHQCHACCKDPKDLPA